MHGQLYRRSLHQLSTWQHSSRQQQYMVF
jgi:hypothetical protein